MNKTNTISVFNNPEFGQVRTVTIDGEPWFVAADVCGCFSVSNSRNVVARLDDDEKGSTIVDTPGGPQTMTVVNESGLYHILFTMTPTNARGLQSDEVSKRLEQVKRFRRWVTTDVVPSIRKTGGYMTPAAMEVIAAAVNSAVSACTSEMQATIAEQAKLLAAQQDKLERYIVKIGKGQNYTNYFLLREFGSGTKSGWKDTVSARLKVIEDATSISGLDQLRNVYLYMGRKYGVDWEQYGDMYKKVHGAGKVSTLDIVCDSELLMGKFDEAMTELFGRLELPLPEIPEPKPLDGEADPFDELVARVKKRRAVAQEFRSNRSVSAAV